MPVFACPKCNTPLQLPDQMAGKMFACPRCQQQLVIPSASSPPAGIQAGAPPAPAAPPPGSFEAPRERRSAPPPPADDMQFQDDRPRRRNKGHQDQEVGTIAATSSSTSWSKPLLFGLMGALGCLIAALLICGPHILLLPGAAKAGSKSEVSAKADVMFVLDVSGSMQFAINGVSNGINEFVQKFKEENLDVHVGLTVYRDEQFRVPNDAVVGIAGDPWTFRFGSGVYTGNPDEFRNIVSRIQAVAGGDLPENALEALRQASKFPVREGAVKVLILITDAPPKIFGGEPMDRVIVKTKDYMIGEKVRQVHLIVGAPGGADLQPIYERLWDNTPLGDKGGVVMGGKYFDLNRIARGEGFSSVLSEFKRTIIEEARRGIAGTTSQGEFDASQAWRLILGTSLLFGFLAFGLAVALSMGQRMYMRQSMFDAVGILKGLITLGAGMLGGALVDFIVTRIESPPVVVILIVRTLAWTFVGAIIGLAMSLTVPNLKLIKGLLGGSIGGFAGGLLFSLVGLMTGGLGPIVGTLLGDIIGAIVLGFCVGVMVALAEVAFRRWWLEVRYGAREVRTVTLGTAPVTVGSDERRATVVVNDVSALVMRYKLDNDRIVCEDLESGQRTELQAGDSRKIGNVTITVCSPETVTRTGLMLELSTGHKVPLSDGLPLTAEELPGLQSNSPDGTVAIVGKKPSDPNVLLLRNRSKQSWTVHDAQGGTRSIDPGLGLPLEPGVEINFGRVQGRLTRGGGDAGGRRRR